MDKTILITVYREPSEKDWTLSRFELFNGVTGVGVEDEKRDVKVHGETCIPIGIYEIDITDSPKFSKSYYVDKDGYLSQVKNERFNTPHKLITLLKVPNFSRVLWHWGNTDDDTDACYIVGSNFGKIGSQKGVTGSRVKYTQIYPILWKAITEAKKQGKKVYIEYKEKQQSSTN